MSSSKIASVLSLVALVTFPVACGGLVEEESPNGSIPSGREPTTEETTGMSTAGLTLTEESADRVAGSFRRDEVEVRFELTRAGDAHEAKIFDAAGEILLESTFENGDERITFLGGKATASGSADAAEPKVEGDAHIFEALNTKREMKLIAPLKEALFAKGVDPSFFSSETSTSRDTNGGIQPRKWMDTSGYWHLGFRESHVFGTWAFSFVSTVAMYPESARTFASVQAHVPWAAPEYINVASTVYLRRQYWGVPITVTNWMMPAYQGQNTALAVRIYP